MTATTIRVQMAQRKDTAANWTSANPILLSGEIGYETDTKKFKIGNGSSNWNSLAYLPIPDGSGNLTITGNLEIGSTGSLTFEGSTADAFETTLAVTNPTADRTITLPDRSGTVITSGDTGTVTSTMLANGTIVDEDISATAAIAGSKLQAATTSNAGAVQLTDSISSTSTTTAATPNSVKSAYDLADAALPKAGGTLTGDVTLNAQSDLRFADSDSSNWVAFQAPATVASNVTWTLPSADGTSGQVLSTNGSGTLSWSTSGGASITQGNTTAEVIDTGSDGRFVVTTEGTERLRVDSSGRLGVGTTTVDDILHLKKAGDLYLRVENSSTNVIAYFGQNSSGTYIGNGATGSDIRFLPSGTERARLTTSGQLLVGTSTARDNFYGSGTNGANILNEGTTYQTSTIASINNANDSVSGYLVLGKSRGTSVGSSTLVSANDNLGVIDFLGADGTRLLGAARISGEADGTPGANDMPGRLVFSTTADGASSPTERMRIDSGGMTTLKGNGVLLGVSSENNNVYKISFQDAGTIRSYIGASSSNILDVADSSVTQRLFVTSGGAAYNSTGTWGTISDQTLKTDIEDAPSQWNDVKAIRFRKYRFIADVAENPNASVMLGVVAQELEVTSPGLVETNEKGIKAVKQSILLMKAAKALQEAMERIETLEAKVAALESA